MKYLFIIPAFILCISCTNEHESPPVEEPAPAPWYDEVVDIRIYPRGDIRFNGRMISESALAGHVESLNPSQSARARIKCLHRTGSDLLNSGNLIRQVKDRL